VEAEEMNIDAPLKNTSHRFQPSSALTFNEVSGKIVHSEVHFSMCFHGVRSFEVINVVVMGRCSVVGDDDIVHGERTLFDFSHGDREEREKTVPMSVALPVFRCTHQ
jgi:hypothetical protein